MYIGNTSSRGLHYLIDEWILDAAGEGDLGFAAQLRIDLLADGACRLFDDGRLMATRPGQADNQDTVERICTTFTIYPEHPLLGPHRAWAEFPLIMNALSERFVVEVQTRGERWHQEYRRGAPTTPLALVGPSAGTGTTLTFWPDPAIFRDDRSFSFASLRERLHEVACLFSRPTIRLRDQRVNPALECSFAPGQDLRTLLDVHARGSLPVHPTVVHGRADVPEGEIEVAFRWVRAAEERFVGYANRRRTDRGGTHQAGLHTGVARVWNARLRQTAPEEGKAVEPGRISRAGLLAVVAVQVDDPHYGGNTRERLNNPEIEAPVARLVRECLDDFLHDHPDEAEAIAEHLRDAARSA
jgi:DNA gyrase subunit B